MRAERGQHLGLPSGDLSRIHDKAPEGSGVYRFVTDGIDRQARAAAVTRS